MSESRLFLLPDADLADAGARLEERLSAAADTITPEELPAVLDDLMRRFIDDAIRKVGAHEGSLWLLDPARELLVVSYNDRNPAFVGFQQSLDSGIISMVVATEQSSCENNVQEHRRHSSEADRKVEKITIAMIAVPLYYGDAVRGVISCVQQKPSEDAANPPGFESEHLNEIELLAELLGRLIDHRLSRRLLGMEE